MLNLYQQNILQYLDIFLLGATIFLLITSLLHYMLSRGERKKYGIETLATITSYKRYIRDQNTVYESIFHNVTLKFNVDNRGYQVTKHIGRESIGSSKKQDYLMAINDKLYIKNIASTSMIKEVEANIIGKQVLIYCNANYPKDVDLDINNKRKSQKSFIYIPLIAATITFSAAIIIIILKFLARP